MTAVECNHWAGGRGQRPRSSPDCPATSVRPLKSASSFRTYAIATVEVHRLMPSLIFDAASEDTFRCGVRATLVTGRIGLGPMGTAFVAVMQATLSFAKAERCHPGRVPCGCVNRTEVVQQRTIASDAGSTPARCVSIRETMRERGALQLSREQGEQLLLTRRVVRNGGGDRRLQGSRRWVRGPVSVAGR